MENKTGTAPKVSVIIPVYNVEKYLEQCLDSVLNQTLRDIEVICVDDGSTDNSLKILHKYAALDKRMHIVEQKNKGAGAARNKGMSVAQGEYLSFLDSDDFFELNMLETMYDKAEDDGSDIVVCGYFKYDQQLGKDVYTRRINESFLKHSPIVPAEFTNNLFEVCFAAPWSKLIKKELFTKYNLKFETLKSCNDLTCMYSAIAVAQKLSAVDEIFVHYRWNTGSQLSTTRFGKNECLIYAVAALERNLQQFGLYEKFYEKLLHATAKSLQFETQSNIGLLKDSAKKNFSHRLYNDLYCKKNKKDIKKQSYSVKLFFFLPICGWKQRGGKKVWYIFGLPIFKRRKMENNITTKYYICGIPFIKVSNKTVSDKTEKTKQMNAAYEFIHHNIRPKSVLLAEFNNFHGECLVGAAKYFEDLGYNIDVCLSESEYKLNPFSEYYSNNIRFFVMDKESMRHILCHDIMEKYEHIYLNSDFVYYEGAHRPVFNFIGPDIKFPEGRYITMCHHADEYDVIAPKNEKFAVVTLNDFPVLQSRDYSVLNTHWFCDYVREHKNKTTNFICIGQIEGKRKNHSLLFDAIEDLLNKNITNFKVTVIARLGDLNIPEHIKPYLDFKGRLNYHDMYEELKKADFYLTLFDPENPLHNRYLTCGSSGSYQLIYGFDLPCLIAQKFANEINGFNGENSLVYEDNKNLAQAMQTAVSMSDEEYMQKVEHIRTLATSIYNKSHKNLSTLLKAPENKYPQNCFISLGENCFNRTVLTRHHLKQRREYGELSYPFDLCVCSANTALKVIKNDFADYFNDMTWDEKDGIWYNQKYSIRYNHDRDCAQTDKNKLIERYIKRIENFRQIFTDGKKHTFILSTVNPSVSIQDVVDLYEEICNKSQYPVQFIFVNLSKDELKDTSKLPLLRQKDIAYAHIPHPYPNYWGEWYKYEFFNSEEGRAFENKYIDFIEQNLEQSLKKAA